MKHAIIKWSDDDEYAAYHLDPRPYLAALPAFADELPPGARAFALDPAHYKFGDPRCVKNLKGVVLTFSDGPHSTLVATFSPNEWMHTESLVIEYSGVLSLSAQVEDESEEEYPQGMDRVLLDEILPIAKGCTHEIQFTGGSLLVSCADLKAEWRKIDES